MPFLGMRGTGDWVANQRPENWRETILYLFPNGQAPLTAILSKMGSERTTDARYHWWQKLLPDQRGIVTAVTDQVPAAYVNGGAIGLVLTVTLGASADKFRIGHQVILRRSGFLSDDVNGKVTAMVAGASIDVTLLEADGGAANVFDTALIIGNINEEGAAAPSSLMYDPTEYWNYTQIFRTPLEHTRTAMRTKLRTGDQLKQAKKEALQIHAIEQEKAFIFGERSQNTGSGGKLERTTRGIIKSIISDPNASANVEDYKTTALGVQGPLTWLAGGEFWLDTVFEQIFRYGRNEKLALCGSGALMGINRLAKSYGRFELTAEKPAFGISVMRWITPFGTIFLKTHPLFSFEATMRNTMLIVEPENLKFRFVDDTKYKPEIQPNDIDGEKSEYLTEAGLEVHYPQAMGLLRNVGVDRA